MSKKKNNYYKSVQSSNETTDSVEPVTTENGNVTTNTEESTIEEEVIVDPVVSEVSDTNDDIPEIKGEDSIPEDTEEKIEDEVGTTTTEEGEHSEESLEEKKEDEIIIVHPSTSEEGMASGSDDNSYMAVENKETQSTPEEEVSTAKIEEEPEIVCTNIQPVENKHYIKILNSLDKLDTICKRLVKAGIENINPENGAILIGPFETTEETIKMRKKIIGCGLRCTIR